MKTRDCRVFPTSKTVRANSLEYSIVIDGERTLQNCMFNRSDMAFWGFTARDVKPPKGYTLEWYSNGEPHFEPVE